MAMMSSKGWMLARVVFLLVVLLAPLVQSSMDIGASSAGVVAGSGGNFMEREAATSSRLLVSRRLLVREAPVSASTTTTFGDRVASKFAFLFHSLAKSSPTPSSGTPSPGHN